MVLLVSLGAGLQRSAIQSFTGAGDLTLVTINNQSFSAEGAGGGATASGNNKKEKLTDTKLAEYEEFPGVLGVSPSVMLQGGLLRYKRMEGYGQIAGINIEKAAKFFEVETGELRLNTNEVVIGGEIVNNFYDPRTYEYGVLAGTDLTGKTITLVLQRTDAEGHYAEQAIKLRVAGVLKKSGNEADWSIYVGIKQVVDWNTWLANGQKKNYKKDGYETAYVKLDSIESVDPLVQQVKSDGFYAFSPIEIISSIKQTFGIIQIVLGGIAAIALLVAAINIINSMIMAIYERTGEIGLMKAIGATNRDVMLIFIGESASIGFFGGIAGSLFGLLLGYIIGVLATPIIAQQMGFDPQGASLVYTPLWLPIFVLLLCGTVGTMAGVYPALRAVKLDPLEALRSK
ncbi:MAG TPA: ABC transporter permease [Anaerolineales bacterium]|nr:ABC transporter permease [Anaerolineales bacterium]